MISHYGAIYFMTQGAKLEAEEYLNKEKEMFLTRIQLYQVWYIFIKKIPVLKISGPKIFWREFNSIRFDIFSWKQNFRS